MIKSTDSSFHHFLRGTPSRLNSSGVDRMNASRRVCLLLVSLLAVFFGAQRATAQCVSLTTLGSPSTQNFNSLTSVPANNIAWTDNSTVAGWYSTRTTFNAGTGTSNTGALWDFGVAGVNAVTDRALGGIASGGTGTFYWAGCFTNNTGSALTSVDIAYIGEQWRDGGAAVPVSQPMVFEYQTAAAGTITDADTPTTGWLTVAALDFVSPTFTNTGVGVLLDGNAAANRTAKAATITVAVPVGNQFWVRWRDVNDGGNDHGLAVDDFSITPQGGGNAPVVPTCATPITTNSGVATSGPVSATDADGTVTSATITGITPSNPGTITLTGFTPAGGVGGTANATLSVSAATPANNYSVTIQWANNDGVPQTANCVVAVNVTAPPVITFIHDVQGNGATTPVPGSTVTIEGVVIGDYQGSNQLSGFFLQEENTDADADPATSEGIFVFCSGCPTAVAEGQRVQATGVVSEFNNMTEVTAATAPSVVVTNAGNNIALVTASDVDLPIVGVVDDFYEAREGMLVHFVDPLIVSEYFELPRFGHLELFEGGRPLQFTETNPPSVAGNAAYLAALDRRRVILDDDNNNQNGNLTPFQADGMQFVFHPRANGGFSVGTQGVDFFRGGDQITSLTGVLHWSFPGVAPDTWRIRPTATTPATFTVSNPRPAAPPAVGGAIKAAGLNLLNYFTTIDTTSSNSSGPCGPSGTLDCRGADSAAELTRQRARAALVLCTINADVYGLMELENTASATITDLLGAVNTQCGGAHPYTFVNTGGTLGTDAIRVELIYRTGVLGPVGAALVDLDPVHNRPPTAQTFDVVDALNPAFGKRFTVIANHFKSKSPSGATGGDLDTGDGQGGYSATRTAQATRLLSWINSTVVPAAGDPDVLLLGDFNSYAQETPTTTITGGGYTDVSTALLGPAGAYSYLFDGMLGHLDFAFASASLMPQITGVGPWHINADEADLFDYNDEVKDVGEAAFEEKPDGSALVPPRVVFQPGTPYRAADHDPVTLGIFAISDLVVTKTDSPDPVNAGSNITYTITVTNNGPDVAATASWSDNLTTAGTTFVSLPAVAGWSCTTPAVGATGTVTCNNPSFAVGSAVFTLTVGVPPSVAAGTVLTNNATATSASAEGNPGNETGTATTTVATSADLQISKTDSPDPVTAGQNISYQITITNAGPSNAANASFSDPLPAGTTFVSLSTTGPWSCSTPAVGANGTITCTNASFLTTVDFFNLVVAVDPSVAAGTVLTNTATMSSSTTDPNSGNSSSTATTTVATSADLQISKTDSPDPVTAGSNITYQITITNNGPSNAASASFSDPLPAGTTFVSLSTTGSWSCGTPAVGANGTVTCTNPSFPTTVDFFTLVVAVDPSVAAGTVLSNIATMSSATTDPNSGNSSATATTTVAASADLSVTKVDTPDPVTAGNNLTYTITVNNAGPSTAATVSLSDTLPAGTTFVSLSAPGGWSCGTPAVGGTGTITCTNPSLPIGNAVFTLTVNVNAGVANGTVITNTATVSSVTTDPNTGNESGTATTTVGVGSADLSVTKVDTPDPVVAGSNLTYTITVTNAGPSNATSAALSDTLPAGTTFVSLPTPGGWSCTTPAVGASGTVSCSNPSMPVGSSVFTLTVAVNSSVANGTVLTNTATASSATTDPNPGNESGVAATTVIGLSAELSLTKTDSPDPVTAGTNLTYTITVNNAGPDSASTVSVSDTLPANTSFVSLSAPAGWSCTTPAVGAGGTVTCSNPAMAVGSAVFTLTVSVSATAGGGTVISNTATVTSTTADPTSGNESDTETTSVLSPATVTGTKTASGTFAPGSTVTYTIVLSNSGPAAQGNNPGDEFVDVLPSQLTLINATATSGTPLATIGTNTVTWNGSIPAGGSVTITIHALVEADAPVGSTITNQGTINYDADGNGANDTPGVTDDPSQAGSGNSTGFVVVAAPAIGDIPALDPRSLIVLATLLAAIGVFIARRS